MTEFDRGALRADLRQRRRALSAAERVRAGTQVGGLLEPYWNGARLAGYWACDGELPLHALPPTPPEAQYCLPCLLPDKRLAFAPWRPGEALKPNRYGIPEPDLPDQSLLRPEALDVVLVPLIGFTRDGTRLGSGGGYYDRSFAFLNHMPRPQRPQLIGIAYSFQELPRLPAAPWDVALDLIVTEREVIRTAG
ncbi:5-formyltetrahydrofolate cyclo-ligase [Pseudomarimonas arenosa]|uniref:5-formyltetrahydrofolate cyclo-ligase n=1 Tax=Pseudomarimonas arenosa TaxID=2774145 RepID=A0AAW3ZSI1_9GAMM|nr:5-formyltetrahydrofolate cyclo-ligase [Pseudomarimonas arenosa]MBD8527489.1 5-formyltetrahydrofolate cyclo-ligase [Pseudomarimonas arenosa]